MPSNTKFVVAGILLAMGVLIVLAATLTVSWVRSYRSTCRALVSPPTPSLFTEQFAVEAFGDERSVFLKQAGSSLISIEAVGDSPQKAAHRANDAVAKIQSTLSQQQPTAVIRVIEQAQPSFHALPFPRSARFSFGIVLGALFGMCGVIMLMAAVSDRGNERTEGEGQVR